ncbi:ABC transporter substrate-binding protein [Syntrophobotulus glycolicus]|nr:ABC transporter substrate-binding protein [Syntrophobotulus glycolicus]
MKKNLLNGTAFFLVIALFVLTITGCGGNAKQAVSGSKEPVKIRLANLAVGLSSAYLDLGVEKGIFKKYGIDLQIVNFPKGGAEATAGVASGQVDMGNYGTPILTGISKGLPIKIVASPPVKGNPFVLVGTNDTKTVADLKGKSVATGALGGGNHQSFLKVLEGSGVKDSEVKVVATGGTDAFMILKSGKVAAVMTNEPSVSQIEADGSGHVLAKAEDFYGKYQHSFIFATDDFIQNHPESITDFLKASRESYEYCKNNFEELVAKGKTLVGLDESIVREYYKNDIAKWDLSFQVDAEGTENAVKILKGLKEIDESAVFDKDKWINLNFLNDTGK